MTTINVNQVFIKANKAGNGFYFRSEDGQIISIDKLTMTKINDGLVAELKIADVTYQRQTVDGVLVDKEWSRPEVVGFVPSKKALAEGKVAEYELVARVEEAKTKIATQLKLDKAAVETAVANFKW